MSTPSQQTSFDGIFQDFLVRWDEPKHREHHRLPVESDGG
jgi:hypothetical protein